MDSSWAALAVEEHPQGREIGGRGGGEERWRGGGEKGWRRGRCVEQREHLEDPLSMQHDR